MDMTSVTISQLDLTTMATSFIVNGTSTPDTNNTTIYPKIKQSSSVNLTTTTFEPGILDTLSDEKALIFLPVIVFIAILMITGTIGNFLVIYVYQCKYKSRSSNHFIVAMAVFDLLSCVICMPIDIYDVRFHYTFDSVIACKLFRYAQSVTTFGSVIILIEIAFDRYFKICRPLKIVTTTKTKILCVVAGVLALLISVPALILFGISHAETPIPGLFGSDCSVAEEYKDSLFRSIFYKYFIPSIFVITFILLAGLYIRIWYEIKRRKEIFVGKKGSQSNPPSDDNFRGGHYIVKRSQYMPSVSDDDSSVFVNKKSFNRSLSTNSRKSRLDSISEAISRMKVSRTTKVFIAVTIAFVLSYLPTMVVQVYVSRKKGTEGSMAEQLLLKLFARSNYINNVINPVIYSFLNINFRTHCQRLFRSIIGDCKGSYRRRATSLRGSFRRANLSKSDSNHKSDGTKEYEMDNLKP